MRIKIFRKVLEAAGYPVTHNIWSLFASEQQASVTVEANLITKEDKALWYIIFDDCPFTLLRDQATMLD